jgi:hypothetical protein
MSNKERLLLGGIAALIPSLCSLLVLDLHTFAHAQADYIDWIGYGLRVLILFGLGCFFTYVHKEEINPWKLVQLGLGVPALAVSILNSAHGAPVTAQMTREETTLTGAHFSIPFISNAEAQEKPELKSFTLPKQTVGSKILHGVLGTPRKHVWFVIADTASTPAAAREKAEKLSQKTGIHAEVFRPSETGQEYAVVVGENLGPDDAQDLADRINRLTGSTKARIWSPMVRS